MAISEIDRLIELLARLPGLGPRSARRAVLHLVKKREALLRPLAAALTAAAESIQNCSVCGNLDSQDPCVVCRDARRDPTVICVVEEPTSGRSSARAPSAAAITCSAALSRRSTGAGRSSSGWTISRPGPGIPR